MNSQIENFLRIYLTEGVGFKFLKKFYEAFGNFGGELEEKLNRFGKLYPNLKTKVETVKRAIKGGEQDKVLELLNKRGITAIPFFDKNFPEELERLDLGVAALFVIGEFTFGDGFSLVGTRKASVEGRMKAFEFASELVKNGFTVISGGAEGIDRAAHEGAISSGGRTGVVLGEGILNFLKRDSRFAEKILQNGGFLISQFPPLTKAAKWSFPRRNGLIAVLGVYGTMVVEAPERSGALITADYADRLGRKIFAYIGCTSSPSFAGCVRLVEDCKARLSVSPSKLLGFLRDFSKGLPSFENKPSSETENERDKLLGFLAEKPRTFDELLALGGFEEEELFTLLAELEIEGKISAEGGFYKLI